MKQCVLKSHCVFFVFDKQHVRNNTCGHGSLRLKLLT